MTPGTTGASPSASHASLTKTTYARYIQEDQRTAAPLFHSLSRWEARKVVLLGRLEVEPAGTHLVRKGEVGTEMCMLVTGQLRVFDRQPDGRDQVLAWLEPGAVIGEMSLVTQEVRSASVIAETSAEVLRPGLRGARAHPPALPLHRGQPVPEPRPHPERAAPRDHDGADRGACSGGGHYREPDGSAASVMGIAAPMPWGLIVLMEAA